MILAVLLVLALFFVQTLLPGRFREAPATGEPGKLKENLGNRDHVRPYTTVGARAARALANMQEAMPIFLALALMNMIVAPDAPDAITGAWIFLIARVIYVPVYLSGVSVLRTLVWAGGLVGLLIMASPLVDRV
jgi:uncharacterized MAPEG superfamily protein